MAGKYRPVLALMICAYGSFASLSLSMAQDKGAKGPPKRGGMSAPDDADQRHALMRAIGEAIQKKYHLVARGVGMQSDCKALPNTTREVAYNIQYTVPYKYVPQNSPLRNGKKWEALHVNLRRGKDDKWTVGKWEQLPNP